MTSAAAEPLNRTTKRLHRILELTTFLASHSGVSISDVCERFGVTRRVLLEDLDILFMCGLPPYTPSELFEVVIDDDAVFLNGADALARPLGLARFEAVRLLTAARLAHEIPDIEETQLLSSAIDKLTSALGEAPVETSVSRGSQADSNIAALRGAVVDGHVVQIEYLTQSRDTMSERDVEPLRLFETDGHWYLSAYCRRAAAGRTFRIDRIRRVSVRDEVFSRDCDDEGFGYSAGADDLRARIRLAPGAGWVSARYPVEDVEVCDDGTSVVEIAASADTFLVRLVISLGGDAEVIDPPWLADAVRERACGLLDRYR